MAFTTLWLYNNLAQGNHKQLCVLCRGACNEGHSYLFVGNLSKGNKGGNKFASMKDIKYVHHLYPFVLLLTQQNMEQLVICFRVLSSLVPSSLYLNPQGWCKHFIIYLTFWLTRFSIICLLCVGLNLRLCLLLVLVIDMCVLHLRTVDGFFLVVRSCR